MRNIKSPLWIALFSVAFLCFFSTTAAFGAEQPKPDSIKLSPTSKQYQINAGETVNDSIDIYNDGETTYTFKVYAKPYSVQNEGYDPDFYNETTNSDVHKWFSTEKNSFVIQPKQKIVVPYTLTVPANAAPGGHYGAIFAEALPSSQVSGTSIGRTTRVGALVYATVKGEYQIGGKLLGISIPFLQFKSPLKTETRVQNTGNTDFQVKTVLGVTDAFGNMKYSETKNFRVFPGTTRNIGMNWDKSPSFGFYKVTTTSQYLDNEKTKTTYVLMAPILYYMIFAVGLLVVVIFFVQKRR